MEGERDTDADPAAAAGVSRAALRLRLRPRALRESFRQHWSHRQSRNAYYLQLNSITGAFAGLLFWLVVVRLYTLPQRDIGIGLGAINLATALALVAKGGLDVALLRHAPRTDRRGALRLLGLSLATGLAALAGLTALLLLTPAVAGAVAPDVDPHDIALVAILAALLVATWLGDALFLAEGQAKASFQRNLVLHGTRLVTPALVLAIALPFPVPVSWGLAIALSGIAALLFLRGLPDHRGDEAPVEVPRGEFLRTAGHNITGNAAEFVPGLLLVPLVLQMRGPLAAAYFGIAWTGASALFMLSAAITRSTFAEMSRRQDTAAALRHGARQHFLTVVPAAVVAVLLAPWLLGLFGPEYAAQGLGVFLLLAASVVLVAPVYLYMSLLRSQEHRLALLAFPATLLAVLFATGPWLLERYGLTGVGIAWVLAYAPLALVSVWGLHRAMRPAGARAAPQARAKPGARRREVSHGPP